MKIRNISFPRVGPTTCRLYNRKLALALRLASWFLIFFYRVIYMYMWTLKKIYKSNLNKYMTSPTISVANRYPLQGTCLASQARNALTKRLRSLKRIPSSSLFFNEWKKLLAFGFIINLTEIFLRVVIIVKNNYLSFCLGIFFDWYNVISNKSQLGLLVRCFFNFTLYLAHFGVGRGNLES